MQSAFAIITKLIASENCLCKEAFCKNSGRDGKIFMEKRMRGSASKSFVATEVASSKQGTHGHTEDNVTPYRL